MEFHRVAKHEDELCGQREHKLQNRIGRKAVERRELSYTVGGNANWCGDYAQQ